MNLVKNAVLFLWQSQSNIVCKKIYSVKGDPQKNTFNCKDKRIS